MERDADERQRSITLVGRAPGALARAAAALLDRAKPSADGLARDLSDWMLVVPGARAGRLVLRALVDEAAKRGTAVDPPDVATAGSMIERLFRASPEAPAAATLLERRLAWTRAFESAPRATTEALVARGREPDRDTWRRLAAHAVRLEDELAAAGRGFADLAAATEALGADPARALAFESVSEWMHRELRALGLMTPHEDRHQRLQRGEVAIPHVALLGVLELGAPQREALSAARTVLALVVSDESRREHFDEFGAAAESWVDVPIRIPDDLIVAADGMGDQAEAALEFLADEAAAARAAGAPMASDDAVIGLGDESLGPSVVLRARDAGLDVHDAAGTPLLATSVGRALSLLHEWTRARRPASLAALLRHPAVERYLRAGDRVPGDPLAALDVVRAKRLPSKIERADHETSARQFGRADRSTELVVCAIRELDSLLGPAADAASLLAAVEVLGWDTDDRPALARAVETIAAVGATAPALLTTEDFFQLVLDELARVRVPGEPRERSIEALGWLELLLEPARTMVVLGMNEGCVPGTPPPDPLLTESLRVKLQLPTRRARAARDAAVLDALLHRIERIRFVCGRTAEDGVPLEPSRFLLAADGAALAVRAKRLFDPRAAIADRRAWRRPGAAQSAFQVPKPPRELADLASMRVTGFKDYLDCPLRFWLRHVEGLEEITDDARELAPPNIGTLAHDVLATAAKEGLFDREHDAERLADELVQRLEGASKRQFGATPVPAVGLQLLAFRPRLARFAAWQAMNSQAGWTVRFVEDRLPEKTIVRPTPAPSRSDAPMTIVGRIDRIDWHAESRRWRIIDFKTSDRGEDPRTAHVRTSNAGSRWLDLQLPLYLHGMRDKLLALEPDSAIELGYVLLPADETKAGWSDAAFKQAELEDALRVAADVVGAIRGGEFDGADRAPKYDPFATLLQRPVFGSDDADDDEVAP